MSARLLAWSLCAVALLVVATTVTLTVLNRASIDSIERVNAIEIVLPVGFAILGGLVASRRPRNVLGWIFLTTALCNAVPGAALQYVRYAFITNPEAPFTPWIPWLGYLTSALVYPSGLALLAMLLIPNGRLLSDRWRWVAWAGVTVALALLAMAMVDPSAIDVEGAPAIPNPTGIPALQGLVNGPIGSFGVLHGLALLVVAASSIIVRLRRAAGDERAQLRWVAYGTLVAVASNVVVTLVGIFFLPTAVATAASTIVTVLGFGVAMPASFAIAILRYRLYDLDLLLNRTALYGAVSVVVLLAFGVANVLAQRALESALGAGSDLVAGGLGLAAGLAFGPVRRWIRPLVDRALPARARLTMLFTDIVESTQAIVDLGDERWREVLDQYRSTVRADLTRWRGREVNTAGDAFFAAFDRPMNAIRCALSMRDAVGGLGLRVRIGLHVGEVEMRGEQVSGLAVHAAARVMGQAGAGEIVVSAELAAELPEGVVLLHDAGRRALRGVPGEWQLFSVAEARLSSTGG
jgi:class 3 adenylate cyclase